MRSAQMMIILSRISIAGSLNEENEEIYKHKRGQTFQCMIAKASNTPSGEKDLTTSKWNAT